MNRTMNPQVRRSVLCVLAIALALTEHNAIADLITSRGAPCNNTANIPPLGPGVYTDMGAGAHCWAIGLCQPGDTTSIPYISVYANLGCPTHYVTDSVTINPPNGLGFVGSGMAEDETVLANRGTVSAWTYCVGTHGVNSTDHPEVCDNTLNYCPV